MSNFIEMDHTSSGVQIAASLTRDKMMATKVNITDYPSKVDLYTTVCNKVNNEFEKLNAPMALERNSIKPAVIARVYGASRDNDDSELSSILGMSKDDNPELFKVFSDVLDNEMRGVVDIQSYFKYLCKEMNKLKMRQVSFPIADGSLVHFEAEIDELDAFKKMVDLIDSKGKRVQSGVYVYPLTTEAKLPYRSMVAAFIQSFDAFILAQVKCDLFDKGIPVMAKHDAYLFHSMYSGEVVKTVQKVMFDTFNGNRLNDLTQYLNDMYGLRLKKFGELFDFGEYDPSEVLKAQYLIG